MISRHHVGKSIRAALWMAFLTFPLVVIKVNPVEKVILWRWGNLISVAVGSFLVALLVSSFKARQASKPTAASAFFTLRRHLFTEPRFTRPILAACSLFAFLFPLLFSTYQTSIMTSAMIYVVLGLGLNIVVGLAGLLDLGYVAFYAVGAYSYALLNHHYGLGFWAALPVGGLLGAFFGIMLGFPVLRLRGDYLAIVTLGFGEIIRLILENWNDFSFGPSGIANIPRPTMFGLENTLSGATSFMYYLMLTMAVFTVVVVRRLRDSRIGRAWLALREDEIACQAMGIDRTRTKLTAFALGATWAGMVGVIFAAKTTFINPASFTFLESAIILSIVVLGGMGSVVGVIIAALLLILLPEYLRAFQDYRMLVFGAVMVLMMIFRPQGIMRSSRRRYLFDASGKLSGSESVR